VNYLGESSQFTDITPVVEPSFGGLATSALSRNRRSFVWQPINGEEVYTEYGRMSWRCKRCKPCIWCRCVEAGNSGYSYSNNLRRKNAIRRLLLSPVLFCVCTIFCLWLWWWTKAPSSCSPRPRNAKTLVDHEISLVCPARRPTQSRPVRFPPPLRVVTIFGGALAQSVPLEDNPRGISASPEIGRTRWALFSPG